MGSENLPPSFVGQGRNYELGPSPRLPPLYPQVAQQTHGQAQSRYPSRHLPQGQPPPPLPPPPQVQLRTAGNGYVPVDERHFEEGWHQAQAQAPGASQPLQLKDVGSGEGYSYHQPQQPPDDYLPQFVPTQRYHPEDPAGVQYHPHYHYRPQQQQHHQLCQAPDGAMANATAGYCQLSVYPYPSAHSALPQPPLAPSMSIPPRYHNALPQPYNYDQYGLKYPVDRTGYPITGPTQAQAQPSGHQGRTVPAGASSSGTYGGGGGGGGSGGSGYTSDKPHRRHLSPSPPPVQVQKLSILNPPGSLKRLNPFSPPFRPLDASSNPLARSERRERNLQDQERVQQEQHLGCRKQEQKHQIPRPTRATTKSPADDYSELIISDDHDHRSNSEPSLGKEERQYQH
ncbi:hypothetical protein H1R20_g2980, partial [Candolleomyces eurysporus]